MGDSQFYITLPSNSSMSVYPKNTLSNYITKLSQSINLSSQWEVGLSEIQYSRTWYNVRKDEYWIYVNPGAGKPYGVENIPQGYYSTIESVIEQITQAISRVSQEATANIQFTYNNISARVYIELKNGASVSFANDLAVILGFETPFQRAISKSTVSPRAPNINLGMYSLYVYCDLVQSQLVGDTQVPLLRIVPIEGKHGDVITRTYQSPQYLPVSRKNFESIEVDIKDDTGENIPFESGKSVITLHFRLKQSPYFN